MNSITRTHIYGSYPKWERFSVPESHMNGPTWERQLSEIWKCTTKQHFIICQIRNLSTSKFGSMRHIVTKVVDKACLKEHPTLAIINSLDPSYSEKVSILMAIGKWKQLALEVFPRTEDLVDRANLYHIWEVEDTSHLPFDISHIKQNPNFFADESTGKGYSVEYELHGKRSKNGIVGYLYLRSKDGSELKWKQKQQAKNDIIGEDMVAVEVISENFMKLGYTCLICFPIGYRLDFGINSEERSSK